MCIWSSAKKGGEMVLEQMEGLEGNTDEQWEAHGAILLDLPHA